MKGQGAMLEYRVGSRLTGRSGGLQRGWIFAINAVRFVWPVVVCLTPRMYICNFKKPETSALYLDIYRYEKGDPWIPYKGSPVEFRGVVCYVVGYFL